MRIAPVSFGLEQGIKEASKVADKGSAAPSFADELMTKIKDVDELQHKADQAGADAAVNGATNMHETLIQVEEADISLRMLGKFRNKALDAYHEIMRMQF